MLTYGFYNSVAGDRTYDAEQLSSIFEGMIHDGIFEDIDDKLMVEATTGMSIKVGTGRAWFNQTWTKNDSDIVLVVDTAEVVLKRIDVVVLEVNSSVEVRSNSIKIVKGTPSSTPVAPTLTNTENIHQYPLAEIFVDASVVEIVSEDITNKVGTVDCPYVTGVLRNIDTVAVDAILQGFLDLEQEVEDNRTYYDANIGQTVNKTSIITTTGSANAYVGSYESYEPIAYDGMIAVIKANFSNTGSATINVQSIGVKTIKKISPGGLVDLATGDIISGGIYTLFYNGTYFVLGNPLPIYASMFTGTGDIPYTSGPNTFSRLSKGGPNTLFGVNGSGDLSYLTPSFESGSWSESGTLNVGTYTKTITLNKRGLFGVARLINNYSTESLFVAFGISGGYEIFGQTQYNGSGILSSMSRGFQAIGVGYQHYINFQNVAINDKSLSFSFRVDAQNNASIGCQWGCFTL